MSRRLLISFSGGETSAYMTQWILRNWRDRYDEIIIVFANTGQENEATLVFVDECDRLVFAPLGARVVWIEAAQHHGQRKSPTCRVVDFASADRNGQVFEDAISKYGIPNSKFKDCTRNLKLRPIQAYAASLDWQIGSYDTAIGIRADEIDRVSGDADKARIVYPLVSEHPRTKPHINAWWQFSQPFRLRLKGYQGNCKWCWKKSLRKHLTIIAEDPAAFDFPRRMEAKYPHHGAEFRKAAAGKLATPLPVDHRRVFFRESRSTADLFDIYEQRKDTLVPADDDAAIYDMELDAGGGCEESCEVFAAEDMAAIEDDFVPDDLFSVTPRSLAEIPAGTRAEWQRLGVPLIEQHFLAGLAPPVPVSFALFPVLYFAIAV